MLIARNLHIAERSKLLRDGIEYLSTLQSLVPSDSTGDKDIAAEQSGRRRSSAIFKELTVFGPRLGGRVIDFVHRQETALQCDAADHDNLAVALEDGLMIRAMKQHRGVECEDLGRGIIPLRLTVWAGAGKTARDENLSGREKRGGMVRARYYHEVRRRAERLRRRVVNLSRLAGDAIYVAATDEHRPVREPRRHMAFATLDRKSGRLGKAIVGRIEDIRALASCHQHGAAGEESRAVLRAHDAHAHGSETKGAGRGIVELSRLQGHPVLVLAPGHENTPVGEQGGSVILPRDQHCASGRDQARGRIIKDGRGKHRAFIHAARDQHLAGGKERGGVAGPFRCERNGLRLRGGSAEQTENGE